MELEIKTNSPLGKRYIAQCQNCWSGVEVKRKNKDNIMLSDLEQIKCCNSPNYKWLFQIYEVKKK